MKRQILAAISTLLATTALAQSPVTGSVSVGELGFGPEFEDRYLSVTLDGEAARKVYEFFEGQFPASEFGPGCFIVTSPAFVCRKQRSSLSGATRALDNKCVSTYSRQGRVDHLTLPGCQIPATIGATN